MNTGHVSCVFVFIFFMDAHLPILLCLSTAVMATKSRHVSEVMATLQIGVVTEEKREPDPFFAIGSLLCELSQSLFRPCCTADVT